ncbi:MAG: DNA integrity scanning diadenylate cyclase DisA [Actinobacteria bacterium]|nr:DNA integrity scanning diadenylate cyclase DisA [Actinomycetota bacterium]MCL5886577.1 DNA integrity scanning diadenylate cyclase DisA [Actinomycetota bacterium]
MDSANNTNAFDALPLLAVGMPLREGLERVVQAHRGALVVMSDREEVLSLCSGGFLLNTEFSPQRLAELAKMDGAIVLSEDTSHISRANVHLVPNHSIPTSETGTRHRTAERVARSTGVPVVSVSTTMGVITLYEGNRKHVLKDRRYLFNQTTQVIQTLTRFRQRFDLAITSLSALELEGAATLRDVVGTLQPAELVCRLADEVNGYLVELGDDGRLLKLQLDELSTGIVEARNFIMQDYVNVTNSIDRAIASSPSSAPISIAANNHNVHANGAPTDGSLNTTRQSGESIINIATQHAIRSLQQMSTEELADTENIARAIKGRGENSELDSSVEPRGYRLLHRLSHIPDPIVDRIVEHFGNLQAIMRASQSSLEEVEGVGTGRATTLRNGLARLAEMSILERYE